MVVIALAVIHAVPNSQKMKTTKSKSLSVAEIQAIATHIETLHSSGQHVNLVNYCQTIEKQYGTLELGFTSNSSSPYVYLGAALYSLHRTEEAIESFKKALVAHPDHDNTLINLGEIQLQTFKLDDAMQSFRKAYDLGYTGALSRILRTVGWSADWENIENFVAQLEELLNTCDDENNSERCVADSTASHEYTDAPIQAPRIADFQSVVNHLNPRALTTEDRAPLWTSQKKANAHNRNKNSQRLKVGLVSSDFNVHPVSQLIRGLIQFVDKERIELYCYSLQSQSSWWGDNITASVEHFVSILDMNHRDAAQLIATHQIEILIDLNGHTMFSGLPIFQFRPAPVQMSFLGLPTSTSAEYIDYYLGDYVSNPPELRDEFLESLALLPPSYIVSDYAQIVGDIADRNYDQRAPRSCFFNNGASKNDSNSPLDDATVLLATFSNSQKLDPATFQVWMNVLNSIPGSKMLMMEYRGAKFFLRNLHRVTSSFGIETDRYMMVPQMSYIDHLDCKTSIDLAFDTVAKNGHTTGLDALWAGIPVLAVGGRNRALSRAAESMAVALDHELGLTYSLKEYEDVALRILKDKRRQKQQAQQRESHQTLQSTSSLPSQTTSKLATHKRSSISKIRTLKDSTSSLSSPISSKVGIAADENRWNVSQFNVSASPMLLQWRREIHRQRRASTLFNTRLFTKYFERYMESIWEVVHLQAENAFLSRLLEQQERYQRRKKLYPNKQQLFHIFPAKSQLPAFQAKYEPLQTTTMRAPSTTASSTGSADPNAYLHASMNKVSSYMPKMLNYSDPAILRRFSTNNGNKPLNEYEPIPNYVFDGRLLFLNIGGVNAAESWLLVNNQRENYFVDAKLNPVDIVRDMDDLYGIPDNSVSVLYSSHTLEHQSLAHGRVEQTLAEWFRVIRPGGLVFISVPDITVLAKMILDTSLTMEQHWMVIMMMYGGQFDSGDFHHVGFSEEFLYSFLENAGFCEIERVKDFNLMMKSPIDGHIVHDTSTLVRYGYFISLNMVARVCPSSKPKVDFDGFSIRHAATKYNGELEQTL